MLRLDIVERERRSPEILPWAGGSAPDGGTLEMSRRGWRRDGAPWFPLSGEYHFSRAPRARWRAEVAKMKASGLDIIATYVLWNHHETAPGRYRWHGDFDLRAFVETCAEQGMLVWLRIGPYCNAEATDGGLPSFALAGSRSDDARYLAQVEQFWRRISAEISGLSYLDGGPIVGVQVENEFDEGDPAHIATLLRLATSCGIRAPFFSVTSNTRFDPSTPVLPLLGGYTYRGWEPAGGTTPTSGFSFGTDEWQATTDLGEIYYDASAYPRGYIEMGTGSPMRGLDRFHVDHDDVLAQAYDALGRGSSMLGYYMFHGGTQLPGLHGDWSLSYDFQAPVGEFGVLRESWAHYRRLHSLIRDFTAELDATDVTRDPEAKSDPEDTTTPRHIGRFDEDGRGFWFVSNRQRNLRMPPRDDLQVEVRSPAGSQVVPDRPVTLPDGAYGVFPVRLAVGDSEVRWATLQPLARLTIDGIDTVVMWRPEWSPGEFATTGRVSPESGIVATRRDADGVTVVSGSPPWSVRLGSGRVIVLDSAEALRATRVPGEGAGALVLSHGGDLVDIDALRWLVPAGGELVLDVLAASDGALDAPGAQWENRGSGEVVGSRRWAITAPVPTSPQVTVESAGDDGWEIVVPSGALTGFAELHLSLDYVGSSATLLVDGVEVTEDLYHGDPWTVDLVHAARAWPGRLTVRLSGWDDGIRGIAKPAGAMPRLRGWSVRALVAVDWRDRGDRYRDAGLGDRAGG